MKDELMNKLKKLAQLKSKPFCYGCYMEAPLGRCQSCGSDDLMRMIHGVGCEWGFDWVIEEILSQIEPANADELFEESIRSCYPEETKIGWLSVDTVTALKNLDPISWDLAKSEWLNQEESEELLVSFDNGASHYEPHQLQIRLTELLLEGAKTG